MALLSRTSQATLLLIGTIVGVGMFGIPFVFSRAGFLLGALELAAISAAAVAVHLAYAEVVLATAETHRLPGYVRLYLGRIPGLVARSSYLFGLSGTLLAYLVLGGSFLGHLLAWLLPGIPPGAGPAMFYLIGLAVIFRGIRFESLANAVLTLALVAAIAALSFTLLGSFSGRALLGFHAGGFFWPYGVLIFAMAGGAIIPDMRRLLGHADAGRLPRLVVAGTASAALLYFLFSAAVVGVSGDGATPDAIAGLARRFGPGYLLAGSLIGFLAAITSFITIGMVLEGMFISDMRIRPRPAWFFTAVIPAGLYLLGLQDFIAIISLIGAVGIGLDSMFILILQRVIRRSDLPASSFRLWIPEPVRIVLIAMFAFGAVYEFFSLF